MNTFWMKPREWIHTHYCAIPVLQQKALTFLSHYVRKETLLLSQYLYKLNSRFWWYVCNFLASCTGSECTDSASYIRFPLCVIKCSSDENRFKGLESSQAYHRRGTYNIMDFMRERSWFDRIFDQISNLNAEYSRT